VVAAENNLFGESVGRGERTWKDRASREAHSGCEANRRGPVRSCKRAASRGLSRWHNGRGEQWIGALQDVPIDELSKLEVWPDGSAIELEDRDVHISVHGLLTAILPAMLPSRAVAAIFASRGGQATSRAKRLSSTVNGRKGGRPRKRTTADVR
jgi:hypothetical protein